MCGFWNGFEKRAMKNQTIGKAIGDHLMSVLEKSKSATDQAYHRYIQSRNLNFDEIIAKHIRRMGEAPGVHSRHNVDPRKMRSLVHEVRQKSKSPEDARKILEHYTRDYV